MPGAPEHREAGGRVLRPAVRVRSDGAHQGRGATGETAEETHLHGAAGERHHQAAGFCRLLRAPEESRS